MAGVHSQLSAECGALCAAVAASSGGSGPTVGDRNLVSEGVHVLKCRLSFECHIRSGEL